MWVMITGVIRIEDAFNAYERRANALGLLVEPGRASENSFISPEVAISITKCIPSVCECVLVTHLIDVREIMHLASIIGVKIIQLPGNVTPKDIVDIKDRLPYIKVIKSLHVVDNSCMEDIKKYIGIVDAIELDTIDIYTCRIGGTGKTHDWSISREIVRKYGYKVPIILAGGLHSGNVERAIQTVEPFGVDVSSGVKDSEGIQDNEKLASFIYNAKHVRSLAY